MKHVAYALRALRRSPGFTLSALAILTLGIGANTAIFGIVNAVLLKPLPFRQAESIVTVFHIPPPQSFPGVKTFSVSAANYIDWKKQNTVFSSMAVIGGRGVRVGGGSRPHSLRAIVTEPDFFTTLGVQPAAGRVFTAAESTPGHDDVVVLSYGFAQGWFGDPAKAVGRQLELNGRPHRVVGVMPPWFQVKSWSPAAAEMWLPLAWSPAVAAVRGNHNYLVVARLRPGVTLNQAQAQMNVISERLARDYPEENSGWGAVVNTLRDDLVGDVRPALLTLLGAVGFVLLIACANTANLVLARTITRRKELAIRLALGGSAGQVFRPVLVETTVLSVLGGLLGLLLARSGQALVLNALADKLPPAIDVQVDARVLAFTLLSSVFTGLAAGSIAAWRLTRVDVNDSLRQGLGKTDAFSGGRRTRIALVVAEVALSLVLLVGAGLMVRSLWALALVNAGFQPSDVATMTVSLPAARLYNEFFPQVRRLPGVAAAGAIDTLPLDSGGSLQPVVVEGRPAEVFALQPNVAVRVATPGYLRTLRIPLVAGRDLDAADTRGQKAVVLISQSMARQFWPGQNPLGKRLRISFTPEVVREVVGVVGDVKERGLDVLEPVAMLYEPLAEAAASEVSLVVRTEPGAPPVAPALMRILHRMNPELPVRAVRPMDELVAESLSQYRFSMYLFVALASLAFLLAAVGIYSVLAFSVRTRVQEIGIRMAVGAGVSDVLKLIVSEGMKPTVAGIAIGCFGAWLLSGILSSLIYGVSATDPWTFAAVVGLLTTVALAACLLPAWRATRVQPVTALRNE